MLKSNLKVKRKSIAATALSAVTEVKPAVKHGRQQPEIMSGWMEKKTTHAKRINAKWQRRYFIIKTPGNLYYFKSEDTSGTSPQGVVDLRLVINLKMHTHQGSSTKDATRIDMELAQRTFKLRCSSDEEGQNWLETLLNWRDYARDHAASVPSQHHHEDEDEGAYEKSGPDSICEISGVGEVEGEVEAVTTGPQSDTTTSPFDHAVSIDILENTQPKPLEGMLKKKAMQKKNFYNVWQDRYVRVCPDDHSIKYYKSKNDQTPKGSIDILLIVSVDLHVGTKDNGEVKDPTRFDINMGGSQILRMKAESADEANNWIEAINSWKDYLLMHMTNDMV